MTLEITGEGWSFFLITIEGEKHVLDRSNGPWELDGQWLASSRLDWQKALARALTKLRPPPPVYTLTQYIAEQQGEPHD